MHHENARIIGGQELNCHLDGKQKTFIGWYKESHRRSVLGVAACRINKPICIGWSRNAKAVFGFDLGLQSWIMPGECCGNGAQGQRIHQGNV